MKYREASQLPLVDGGIHSQCFHEQVEVAAVIGKNFMRIIWKHGQI